MSVLATFGVYGVPSDEWLKPVVFVAFVMTLSSLCIVCFDVLWY